MKTLIIGCGSVGRLLANRLHSPIVWVRSRTSAEPLNQAGFNVIESDLSRPVSVPLDTEGALIYYFVPPPKQGQTDTHLSHFIHALKKSGQPRRVLYLSTTGIYGDAQGQWIDEDYPPAPIADRALRRFNAEKQWQDWQKKHGGSLIILRTASIYGPGKWPLNRLIARRPMVPSEQSPWTNRIHIDDLVNICQIAMNRAKNGSIYNVSDGHPLKMSDYFNRIADHFGLERPPIASPEQLSEAMRSYLAESRRISNRRLLHDLNIQLNYPHLEQGLKGLPIKA